jgi:hypothetical protein
LDLPKPRLAIEAIRILTIQNLGRLEPR